jgi:cis-3-alkyl-4-acyloxetan-2-one decarboxylase
MDRLPAPALPAWISRQLPAGIERYLVDLGGPRMHVMEVGRGRPVLLLHGNPTWGFLYRKVASALAGEPLRLIMPDLLGLGLSDKPDKSAHSIEAHGALVARLIAGLGLDDFLFVGQDWGGPIGLRALCERPAALGGIVLLNTVVGPPRPGFRPSTFHRFARLPLLSDLVFRLGFPQNVLSRVQGDPSSIRGEVARAYRWPLRHLRDRIAPLAMARMVPDSPHHPSIAALTRCQEMLTSFRGPTALVWGERDPILGNVGRWVEKLLPEAAVTRTQAGHFLQEEVPDAIAAAIRQVAAAGRSGRAEARRAP